MTANPTPLAKKSITMDTASMKKIILTLTAVLISCAVLGILSVAVVDHYNKTNIKSAPATISLTESDKRVKAAQDSSNVRYAALYQNYQLVIGECNKGTVAYEKLSPTQKSQTPAPNCKSTATSPVE